VAGKIVLPSTYSNGHESLSQRTSRGVREMQLIYSSRPFGYDELTLVGILASARRNNERDGITGALICRDDLFVQLLRPSRRDSGLFPNLARRPSCRRCQSLVRRYRHAPVSRVVDGHDPGRSWMWTLGGEGPSDCAAD